MRRYYLSPVVGSGTLNDPYRAQIADVAEVGVSAVIPTLPSGAPAHGWALCLVAAATHTQLAKDARFGALPDMLLDARMAALSAPARNALDAALAKFAIDAGALTMNESYREFVRSLGRRLQADFDENGLVVADR